MKRTIITVVLISIGVSFFSFHQKFDLKASIARGKEVYDVQCIACHLEQGEGIEGVYPPVTKSDYLVNRDRLIKVIRKGVRGSMTIKGVQYDSEMIGFELTDEQTADVINYIRNSWGNKNTVVTPNEISIGLNTASKDYQPF